MWRNARRGISWFDLESREKERERDAASCLSKFSPRKRERERVSNLVVHHPGNGFQLLFLEAGDPRRDVKTEAALHSVAK